MNTPTPRTDAKLLTVAQRTSPNYLPEMVCADFARQLERENAALARWIVYHSEHTSGDHACAECYPHGQAIKAGFRCAVHIARSIAAIDLARKEAQP